LATVGGLAAAVVLIVILFIANRPPAPLISVLHPVPTTPPSLEHGRTLGSADAPVKMDVWSDFQCPFCAQFWTTVEPKLVSTYVAPGDVQLIYHDYTFLGQESVDAAIAARCADRQGKFWEFHDYLYANQGTENSGAFAPARLTQFAEAIGLDMTAWSACLQDPTIAQANQAETVQGQASGISGTPTILVAGTKVAKYDYASISAAIDAALAKAGVTPAPGSSGASPTTGSSPAASPAASLASSPAATP
jgi:protein-disulfide isomerase